MSFGYVQSDGCWWIMLVFCLFIRLFLYTFHFLLVVSRRPTHTYHCPFIPRLSIWVKKKKKKWKKSRVSDETCTGEHVERLFKHSCYRSHRFPGMFCDVVQREWAKYILKTYYILRKLTRRWIVWIKRKKKQTIYMNGGERGK